MKYIREEKQAAECLDSKYIHAGELGRDYRESPDMVFKCGQERKVKSITFAGGLETVWVASEAKGIERDAFQG